MQSLKMFSRTILASRIRQRRKALGIRRTNMAPIKRYQLSKWERGIYSPGARNLYDLAEKLACSVDYLLGLTNNPMRSPSRESNRETHQTTPGAQV